MIIGEGVITILSDEDFRNLCSEMGVSSTLSVDDLADMLWFDKGVVLFDKRDSSEMLQVSAQSSVEFFSEEFTASDINEIQERRKLYEVNRNIS